MLLHVQAELATGAKNIPTVLEKVLGRMLNQETCMLEHTDSGTW